ncbi:hypothetical protein GLAREA_02213 [Glarea lozoyensis ATCC 20868]|uniref:Uncharacterized protein n=1 Tax=Glarea lozoyensis (strain ATCC 20868 / MF5171) TaxID=1116229 RepID=S3D2Q2_GLAL2|nr:uncharacterized protein GLAREA_02213 [Glarea lozoyensis ATCC 20868]EPE26301.1 hypothetical protein GLAREA_02213 [Glarea lozoyensis ATCC 20868]
MHNTFRFGKATHLRNFLHQIGPTNLAHIRELQLWISPEAAIGPWSRALLTLSQQTHSLKILQLEWDESGFGAKRKNFDFMTALIKIRGLEKLVFLESESSGDERKNYWVPYLERKMRIAVEGGMAEKVVEGAVRADAEEVMALEEEIERWVEERGMRKMDDVMPG